MLGVCRRLAGYGIASAIGYSASRGESARAVADIHLAAFEQLSTAGDLDCYVSIKLSALDFDAALFAEVAAAATGSGRRLHIDALKAENVDPTMSLLEQTPRTKLFGTTLPGRWRRSRQDLATAVEMGLSVRVVKGHWNDDIGGSVDPTWGFLDLVESLSGYQGGVAVATHDTKLLRESLHRLTASGTPCHSELFLGMPFRGPAQVAREFQVPVRVYVPYGDAWPGYGLRDLVTHPATVWWLAQDLVLGQEKTWRSIQRSRSKP